MTAWIRAGACGLAAGLLLGTAGGATAQVDFPNRPIRFITPYAPGGSTTVIARMVGQKMTEQWGPPVVVDNRPGASTMIGTETAARAAPDGHTILLVSVDSVLIPQLLKAPYDVLADFVAVGTLGASSFVLLVHPGVPAPDLKAFVALARTRVGQLNYASAGAGTISHLVAEMFCIATGTRMQHVPYKGGGPALIDLIGGHVQLLHVPPVTAIGHVQAGRLRALAVSGEARLPALAATPTYAEAGLPNFDPRQWYGVIAPARTPSATVARLSGELARILALPDIRERFEELGIQPLVSTSAQFGALMRSEMARYGKVIRGANVRVEP